MRNLLSILIVVSLIPIPTLANELEDCKETVNSAQVVIDKQNELIHVMDSRNQDLFQEKTELERQLQESQTAKQTAQEHTILWTVIGVAAGVLATAYVTSRTK